MLFCNADPDSIPASPATPPSAEQEELFAKTAQFNTKTRKNTQQEKKIGDK
jgi:hypothetical protein